MSNADISHILDRTEPLWSQLRGEQIFVTGGTGFFGKWLLEAIAAANRHLNADVRLTVLSRSPSDFKRLHPHLADACTWVRGDICSFDFPSGPFSQVVHAATSVDARTYANEPVAALRTMIMGTERILEFAEKARANNFLFTSSGAIYGQQPADLSHMPESYTGGPDPTSVYATYGEGKRLAELMICLSSAGMAVKIARCFAFVGPYQPLDWHFAVGNFIGDALAGRHLTVKGNGQAVRSYLYAADLVVWLLTILIKGSDRRAYNVGSEAEVSIYELAQRVASVAGMPRSLVRVLSQTDAGPALRYVPDTKRVRTELGLEEAVSLDDGLSRTLYWWRKQQ